MKEELTAEQAEALALESGVVVAGAGAGKTRTLIAKIIHDQQQGIDPALQIVVTFTNAAANEIRDRLERRGAAWPHHLGTLHKLAMRAVKAAWGGALDVIDDAAFDRLIKTTCKRTKINIPVSAVRAWILDPPKSGNGHLLVRALLGDMRAGRQIHPDVMLAVYLRLLVESPTGHDWRVYVDEAQDSSPIDAAIYSNLSKSGRNAGGLILFGDPRQSIYAFRGAEPRIFTDAMRDFGDGLVVLTANFRSKPAIIEAANRIAGLMAMGVAPMVSGLQTSGMVDGTFRASWYDSTEAEVLAITSTIKHELEFGNSVAVLTRFNMVADAAAAILRSEGITVEQPGRETALDPSIEKLKALTSIPDDWGRTMSGLGVPFALQDRLGVHLRNLDDAIDIAAAIDEALGTPTGNRKVWLSTIHGAKGLEFDIVHLIGADNLSLYLGDPEDVRLAYVAVTRARKDFTWSGARSRIAERRVVDLKPSAILAGIFPDA